VDLAIRTSINENGSSVVSPSSISSSQPRLFMMGAPALPPPEVDRFRRAPPPPPTTTSPLSSSSSALPPFLPNDDNDDDEYFPSSYFAFLYFNAYLRLAW